MEDAKFNRWAVTYTKHLKQKRKVYHDGFLELHPSSNKVILYDDGHNLLESRMMKKDEIVTCGETLAFSAYIVDIGNGDVDEHKNDNRPHLDSLQNARIPDSLHGQQVRVHSEGTTNGLGRGKKTRKTLSPSWKIIREFKRRELHKYESPRTSIVATEPSLTEWQVLYSAQVTQKAKKYHDGILQLSLRGSLGRQVMLFDSTKRILDHRFLKKDEVIGCGNSVTFDAYVVDIGECVIEKKSCVDGDSNNCTLVGKSMITHAKPNSVKTDYITGNEWQVLYTNQLTQKAKKYHDGFLHLHIFEPQGRQIVLHDSCRNSLDQRFLKNDETIRTGESLLFDAYLVYIGEPTGKNQNVENCHEKENCDTIKGSSRKGHGQGGHPSSFLPIHKGKERDSKTISFSTFWTAASSEDPSKPLRDARQILYNLKNPAAEESFIPGLRSGCCETIDDREVAASADTRIFPDALSPRETSISGGIQLHENIGFGRSHQSNWDRETVTDGAGKEFGSDRSASLGFSSPCLVKDKGENAEELTCAEEINECPSFDLGF